jgi:Icc-related predicted phosphoesterase
MLRIVAISDLHEHLPVTMPEGDMLIICGDVTFTSRKDYRGQAHFIATDFAQWMSRQDYKYKLWIAGNHDTVLQAYPDVAKRVDATYLCNESVEIEGMIVFGTPWQPEFCNWGFSATDAERREHFKGMAGADLVICHAPPTSAGDLDLIYEGPNHPLHVGDKELYNAIRLYEPKKVFCGHIHEGFGVAAIDHGDGVMTWVYNVSSVDERYNMRQNFYKVAWL